MAAESPSGVGSSLPAGWYPDPQLKGGGRYWDGQTWTQHAVPPSDPMTALLHGTSGPPAQLGTGSWFGNLTQNTAQRVSLVCALLLLLVGSALMFIPVTGQEQLISFSTRYYSGPQALQCKAPLPAVLSSDAVVGGTGPLASDDCTVKTHERFGLACALIVISLVGGLGMAAILRPRGGGA